MKKKLQEWGIAYDIYKDFGVNREKYEHTILHNPQNYPAQPPSTINTKFNKRNKSAAALRDISDEDAFDNQRDTLGSGYRNFKSVKNKNKNTNNNYKNKSKNTQNKSSTSNESEEKSVDIMASVESTDFWRGYNDYQKIENTNLVLSESEVDTVNKLELNSTQIKQMFHSYDNVMLFRSLIDAKGEKINNLEGKLLNIKGYIDGMFANNNDTKHKIENKCNDSNSDSSEPIKLKFDIKRDPIKPDYKQFNVLFESNRYIFPKLDGKISYDKRYYLQLELIATLNNYKRIQSENKQNKIKKKITLNKCYPWSSSVLHYRHAHFMLLLLDENKYEETVKDVRNWMKETESLSEEIIKIADGLTVSQKRNYKFSVPKPIIDAYNSLFGDIWSRIDKLKRKLNKQE